MNRERAETYLRLLAEAELRDPALASPPAPRSADAPFVTAPITLIRAAWALTAVGALNLETAEAILADVELAVAARRRPEAAAFRLRLTPPLRARPDRIEVVVTGRTARARVVVPVGTDREMPDT